MIDKSFTNWSVTSSTTLGNGVPSASDIQLYASGNPPSGNILNPISLFFLTAPPAPLWQAKNGGGFTEDIDFIVTAHTGGTYTGGTYPVPATPGLSWAISQLSVFPSGTTGNGTASGDTTYSFCIGATTVVGCPAAKLGSINAHFSAPGAAATFTCMFAGCYGAGSNSLDLSSAQATEIAFQVTITFSTAGPGSSIGYPAYGAVGMSFGEFATALPTGTPEPSTFWLIGSGLTIVGLLRYRRGKKEGAK
jgi:hypothetical protein